MSILDRLSPRRIYRATHSPRRAMRAADLRARTYRPNPTHRGNPLTAAWHALTRHNQPRHGLYIVGKRRPLPPVRSPRTAQRLAQRPKNLYRPVVTFHPLQPA